MTPSTIKSTRNIINQNTNILILHNSFWMLQKVGVSGGDQMLMDLWAELRNNYKNIYYIGSQKGVELLEQNDVNLKFFVTPVVFDSRLLTLSYIARTIYVLFFLLSNKITFDIVYSSSDFFPDVVPAYVYKLFKKRIKWIQCIMHIIPSWRNRKGLALVNIAAFAAQKFSFFLSLSADKIVCINNIVKSELVTAARFSTEKVNLITPSVDYSRFLSFKSRRTSGSNPASFLFDAVYLGRFNSQKGVGDLPSIWARVTSLNPSAKLAIIGSGNDIEVNCLKRDIYLAGVSEQVHILGFLEKDDLLNILSQSNCFIFPSYEEGFGLVILEALSTGNTVIAWDLPHYSDTFSDAILTVPTGDIELMSQKIIENIANPDRYFSGLGEINRVLQKYDTKLVANRLLYVIEDLYEK